MQRSKITHNKELKDTITMGAVTELCAACGKGSVGQILKTCAGCKQAKYCSVGECVSDLMSG